MLKLKKYNSDAKGLSARGQRGVPTCATVLRRSQQVPDVPHPALRLRLAVTCQEQGRCVRLGAREDAEGKRARPDTVPYSVM